MTDLLLQFGISNFVLSILLALAAWMVHRTGRLAMLAHLLWVLVLVKLITPPIVTLPVLSIPGVEAGAAPVIGEAAGHSTIAEGALEARAAGPGLLADSTATSNVPSTAASPASWMPDRSIIQYTKSGLLFVWLFGSAWALVFSLWRMHRFSRLLDSASKEAAPDLQRLALEIGQRLGLEAAPTIHTAAARISPMVWWVGGRVRIVIPEALRRVMAPGQLRWIIAHELVHVRRRDHLVRWLEWLACVLFWWNPVAWLARRKLRACEEICCDALVLASLQPGRRRYAAALMTVVEFLAAPAVRPPAAASGMNSGGSLERRFNMIVSDNALMKTPRWLYAGMLCATLALMPLGVVYGQDYDAVGKRLREAVQNDELSAEQARAMMDALRSTSADETSPRSDREATARVEAQLRRAVETGRITRREARTRLAEMNRSRDAPDEEALRARRLAREDVARIEARLHRAAEAGRITRLEARKRLAELRARLAKQAERRAREATKQARLTLAHIRIRQAIADGALTAEEARAKLRALRRHLTDEPKGQTDVDLDAVRKRIRSALERGGMTPEEAREAYRKYRQRTMDENERKRRDDR